MQCLAIRIVKSATQDRILDEVIAFTFSQFSTSYGLKWQEGNSKVMG